MMTANPIFEQLCRELLESREEANDGPVYGPERAPSDDDTAVITRVVVD